MQSRVFLQKTVYICPICGKFESMDNECEHDFMPVEFVTSTGGTQIRQFCKKCFHKTSKSEPKEKYAGKNLPRRTFEDYDKFVTEFYKDDSTKYQDFIQSLMGDTGEPFKLRYQRYIDSPEWKALRENALKRDEYKCRICGAPAEEVHHLTYTHLEKEFIFELVSLCWNCHTEHYHPERTTKKP